MSVISIGLHLTVFRFDKGVADMIYKLHVHFVSRNCWKNES